MQLGMIGLGRMGANMVRRLLRAGHECVVHDRSPQAVAQLAGEGATGAASAAELVAKLRAPRSTVRRTSSPKSPASRIRSRAASLSARTSSLVWVRMMRLWSGDACRLRSQRSIRLSRACSRVCASCTMP